MSTTIDLAWTTSGCADDFNHDQEVDLGAIGSPGGAEWAYVCPNGGEWTWGVLDRWLWDDASYLANGLVPDEAQAKQAVQAWVAAQS